jgi:hypothetical protein
MIIDLGQKERVSEGVGLILGALMETTQKIIESYVRYVRRWATIPNIKCKGQYEIDLLAIDPVTLQKYHIESRTYLKIV